MRQQEKMTWKNHTLHFSEKTYVMGILNVTPDSFSDGGKFSDHSMVASRAQQMVLEGADLIDMGAESTRPGSTPIGEQEELSRLIPALREVRGAVDVPISIDTYKASVAEEAVANGADIINDVWGTKADPRMAQTAAAAEVPIVIMHNRKEAQYLDLIEDMKADLYESIERCLRAGVREDLIFVDPGVGFAKTYEENLLVMRNLREFTDMGYPVLLGTSRKSLIAKTLDLPVDDRVEGTGATVCRGIDEGCAVVRVHDVLEMSRMTKMMDAMLGKGSSITGGVKHG
ncbi:dihydropteroate synthase [Alkalicoccus urumqiensis]|uniref:Dihydropteroate synthase n=1 Tax=Alkalicoccus urumqiensis TaxID=1548213 RepID=A0A2P6MDQ5_ALKUR|nr:dihydropteroate synthase [Alkalicoccus urumqiensis]PRO64412.1 dihydropteroate synthase [Alkalicoccus urumqiensis]